MSPVRNVMNSSIKKVKDSPVKNLNESPAEKSKRSHYVAAPVIHQISFASLEDWILSYERTQASLHPSEGTYQTLLDLHCRKILEKDENNLPSEETLVSHDLSTSGSFSNWREPSAFEVVESTLPSDETLVSQDISSQFETFSDSMDVLAKMRTLPSDETLVSQDISSQIETFSDSMDVLAKMRRMTLCSGGGVIYSEPVEKSDLFYERQLLLTCFHCQRNSFVYPPISKNKLVCKKHEDGGPCPFKSDTEKFQETTPAQLFQTKYQYLNYNCFMCGCTSCDLRSFNSDLKCGLCLKKFTLCARCSLLL